MSDAMVDTPAPAEAEPKLRPANKNPWYLLATLHGEQPEDAELQSFDRELHAKNRLAWNRTMATLATPEALGAARALKKADGSPRIPPEELVPFNESEQEELKKRLRARGGGERPRGLIDFQQTAFTRPANFEGFWFAEWVFLNHATFSGPAVFDHATFYGLAAFDFATFSGLAKFDFATFSEHAWFKGATFSGPAVFDFATFSKDASFNGATFSGGAWFNSATFSGGAWFNSATFYEIASFNFTTFERGLGFAAAKFQTIPPNFNGATTVYEGTIWPDADGWPAAPANAEAARDHSSSYERLKKDAETHKKHRQEQFFFAKELECQQVIDGPWRGWPTKLYGILSGFGASIRRPLFWLIGLWAVCGVAFENLTTLSTSRAWGFSAANLFDVLGARKNFFETEMKVMSGIAQTIATTETGFGLLFLFLIGLALRNRFRMK